MASVALCTGTRPAPAIRAGVEWEVGEGREGAQVQGLWRLALVCNWVQFERVEDQTRACQDSRQNHHHCALDYVRGWFSVSTRLAWVTTLMHLQDAWTLTTWWWRNGRVGLASHHSIMGAILLETAFRAQRNTRLGSGSRTLRHGFDRY